MLDRARVPASRCRALAVVASFVSAGAVAGCAPEEVMPPPWCDREGSGVIVAQSVPTASWIPCLTELPKGWSVSSVAIDQRGTEILLDSDRAGDNAARLRLTMSCDVAGAVRSPSEHPGTERFDEIERLTPSFLAERHYVFPGGCVSWRFGFVAGASATESVAIGETLELVSRQDLNDALRDFVDAEL